MRAGLTAELTWGETEFTQAEGNHEPFAALIGIDWSDRKHDVCLVDPATDKRELSVISHTPEAPKNGR